LTPPASFACFPHLKGDVKQLQQKLSLKGKLGGAFEENCKVNLYSRLRGDGGLGVIFSLCGNGKVGRNDAEDFF